MYSNTTATTKTVQDHSSECARLLRSAFCILFCVGGEWSHCETNVLMPLLFWPILVVLADSPTNPQTRWSSTVFIPHTYCPREPLSIPFHFYCSAKNRNQIKPVVSRNSEIKVRSHSASTKKQIFSYFALCQFLWWNFDGSSQFISWARSDVCFLLVVAPGQWKGTDPTSMNNNFIQNHLGAAARASVSNRKWLYRYETQSSTTTNQNKYIEIRENKFTCEKKTYWFRWPQ